MEATNVCNDYALQSALTLSGLFLALAALIAVL